MLGATSLIQASQSRSAFAMPRGHGRVDPPGEADRGRDTAEHRCRTGNRVVLPAGVFSGRVTMSIGMLMHELSVLMAIVNAMHLLRRRGVASAHHPAPPARERVRTGFPIRRSNRWVSLWTIRDDLP